MAMFSTPDEKAIAERKAEQDRREADLVREKAALEYREQVHRESAEAFDEERRKFAEAMHVAQRNLAESERVLFEGQQALFQREQAAKAGSVEQQREAFREVIEKRAEGLDQRQRELDALAKRLAEGMGRLAQKESELTGRETAVLERRLEADADYSERLRVMRQEIETREQACASLEQRLRERETSTQDMHGQLERRTEELRKREEQVVRAEQEREAGYAELRRHLDEELHKRRLAADAELARRQAEERATMEDEHAKLRQARLAELAREEAAERERLKSSLAAERRQHAEETTNAQAALQVIRLELEKRRAELDATEAELDYRERTVSARESLLDRRQDDLEQEISKLVSEREKSFASREAKLTQLLSEQRESLASQEALLANYDQLKRRVGDEPEKALLALNTKLDELKALREELATKPTEEVRDRIERERLEKERAQTRVTTLEGEVAEHRQRLAGESELRAKLSEAETARMALGNRNAVLDTECSRMREDLKRLRAGYEREEEREGRIRDIEIPYVQMLPPARSPQPLDEIAWLEAIDAQCIDYGLRFHPRILRAFHTSLKTAEWSPLTVLAGVSGTGKSELPRLYAHFGGMMYHPLSVQPNWDSQESMLGFFNSIDNKFDAQPVLRFLAQSQKKRSDDYPGLEDALCLVLLDEMNLAHPELYFAEFLSKLELRRGTKGDGIPNLEVKVGAGLPPYLLRLGRNVLWTGTMNQDETTKSLSDKVLDRSIVIHFPRPATLERRQILKPLPAAAHLLPRKIWEGWWSKESDFTPEEIRPFMDFVKSMNDALASVGRALGHRVWQSVEYYMANYPDVRLARQAGDSHAVKQAMHTAFEDQLVQKIMPKLRGIETRERGRGRTECLDKIGAQIVEQGYQIVDDFELALQLGYGQFMWQSANYLREPETPEEKPVPVEVSSNPVEQHTAATPEEKLAPVEIPADLSTPPDKFKKDDPNRQAQWDQLSASQKRIYWQPNKPRKP